MSVDEDLAAHSDWLQPRLLKLSHDARGEFANWCIRRSMHELGRMQEMLDLHGFGSLHSDLERVILEGRTPEDWSEPRFDDRGDLASCPWHLAASVWFQVTSFHRDQQRGEPHAAFFVAQVNWELIHFLAMRWAGFGRSEEIATLFAREIENQRAFIEGRTPARFSLGLFDRFWFPPPR